MAGHILSFVLGLNTGMIVLAVWVFITNNEVNK